MSSVATLKELKNSNGWGGVFALFFVAQESILSSAWCGGKSRLEQMVERQQATLRALLSSHTEKLARLKQQDRLYVPATVGQQHLIIYVM